VPCRRWRCPFRGRARLPLRAWRCTRTPTSPAAAKQGTTWTSVPRLWGLHCHVLSGGSMMVMWSPTDRLQTHSFRPSIEAHTQRTSAWKNAGLFHDKYSTNSAMGNGFWPTCMYCVYCVVLWVEREHRPEASGRQPFTVRCTHHPRPQPCECNSAFALSPVLSIHSTTSTTWAHLLKFMRERRIAHHGKRMIFMNESIVPVHSAATLTCPLALVAYPLMTDQHGNRLGLAPRSRSARISKGGARTARRDTSVLRWGNPGKRSSFPKWRVTPASIRTRPCHTFRKTLCIDTTSVDAEAHARQTRRRDVVRSRGHARVPRRSFSGAQESGEDMHDTDALSFSPEFVSSVSSRRCPGLGWSGLVWSWQGTACQAGEYSMGGYIECLPCPVGWLCSQGEVPLCWFCRPPFCPVLRVVFFCSGWRNNQPLTLAPTIYGSFAVVI